MDFYNLRDTNPEKIYPLDKNGNVLKYDDLPERFHKNVDVVNPPFDKKLGEKPAMSDKDIDDIIAFIKTLDDQN